MFWGQNGQVSIETFLTEYWQRKPLLIRNALPGFEDFITPEELAGLACDEDVESRLVFSTNNQYQVKHGPFREREFTFLSEQDWTLLVQSLDLWCPEVSQLKSLVNFLPEWRIDDIMLSYAVANGGVGPHFDYYDVFLVQGLGTRHWSVGEFCDSHTPVETDSGQKILSHFEATEEWTVETGDILYIPAGYSHYGSAVNPSLCYSIGFRAPSLADTMLDFSQHLADDMTEDQRYRDSESFSSPNPGEITPQSLTSLKQALVEAMNNESELQAWFGQYMTEPRIPELIVPNIPQMDSASMLKLLQETTAIAVLPCSRLAWSSCNGLFRFFADGASVSVENPGALLLQLNSLLHAREFDQPIDVDEAMIKDEQTLSLLTFLYNRGSIELLRELIDD